MTDSFVADARAMLAIFARSDWKDIHIRTPSVELFIAREEGDANPMANGVSSIEVRAPHLATLVSLAEQGSTIADGVAIAVIELLGDRIDVSAPSAGVVVAHCASPGELIEYDQPLLTLTA